jgi:hypothetical protein
MAVPNQLNQAGSPSQLLSTLNIVRTQLKKLRERRVDVSQETILGLMRVFTINDLTEVERRQHLVDLDSLQSLYGVEFDINIIYMLMLCLPPKSTLELFPGLRENIWALGRVEMKQAWRTREAVRLSNDLASSGLIFHLQGVVPSSMMRSALYYFTMSDSLHRNPAIESMRQTLNINASMFADFVALSLTDSKFPPPCVTPTMRACIDYIMKQSPDEHSDQFGGLELATSIAPFSVLFDDASGFAASSTPRICAFDVITNICLAIGVNLPLGIRTRNSFGMRKLVYFPRLACNIQHPAIDFCIPLCNGTIAVLNDEIFWAPADALT